MNKFENLSKPVDKGKNKTWVDIDDKIIYTKINLKFTRYSFLRYIDENNKLCYYIKFDNVSPNKIIKDNYGRCKININLIEILDYVKRLSSNNKFNINLSLIEDYIKKGELTESIYKITNGN